MTIIFYGTLKLIIGANVPSVLFYLVGYYHLLEVIMLWQLVAGWLRYAKLYFNLQSDDMDVGQGLVEYAMILVMVSVVMVVLLTVLGPSIQNIFKNIMFHIQGVESNS
jgi:pilus assembly protein Flp/PilA